MGGDHDELHQHLIDSQRHIAQPGRAENECCQADFQHDRADHNVTIDRRHPPEPLHLEDQGAVFPGLPPESPATKPEAKGKPGPFRNNRRRCHAGNAEIQPEHEPEIEQDIQPVQP